jgi:hypothetical protein
MKNFKEQTVLGKKTRIAFLFLSVIFCFSATSHAAEDDRNEALLQLRSKTIACAKEDKKECMGVCKKAMIKGNENYFSEEFKALSQKCNSLHNPLKKNQEASIEDWKKGDLLKGYKWLPEITATISKTRSGQLNSFKDFTGIRGIDGVDWRKNCGGRVLLNIDREVRNTLSAGIQVRLKYIQSSTSGASICRVGEIEILK